MVSIAAAEEILYTTLDLAVEGILGYFADKETTRVDLEQDRDSIILTTFPRKYAYTFQPENSAEKIFGTIAYGYALWTLQHRDRQKPSIEELTHAIVATRHDVNLPTIIIAKLTIQQLAKLIVLAVGPHQKRRAFAQLLDEAARS